MSVSLFDSVLSTSAMQAVFDDAALVRAMLRFEAALARAQADEGMMAPSAAEAIERSCAAFPLDLPALIAAGRRAGSIAIPLVKALTGSVAQDDPQAALLVHQGSTSQDVIDTAMVLVTGEALALLDAGLARLCAALCALAERHLDTPLLARTLLQPAQVSSFGFKLAGWAAPLVRARRQLRESGRRALQLQLGGAVGTLSAMDGHGPAVAARMAAQLQLACPASAWHSQRDEWVRLGLEVAVLTGSLGKIATDLALMAQGEIGELAEPTAAGRGGSSAMPHKRNPVAAMTALAAAARTPHAAGALLGAMGQQHERGLGNWQAELAEWPGLFSCADGALAALNEAFAGLQVNAVRMRANIDGQRGLVFAEAVAGYLARFIGRPAAHALLEQLSGEAIASGRQLAEVAADAVDADPQLRRHINLEHWQRLFDPVAAAAPGAAAGRALLLHLASIEETP